MVIIMKKLSVEKEDTLIRLQEVSQIIHYVRVEHQDVLVAQLVIEPVDTAVHLM